MALTDVKIRNLKPGDRDRKVSDGGGLYLHLTTRGSRLWRMAYRFQGKQKLLSFGPYPVVSLAMARDRRLEAKRLLVQGRDPARELKQQRRKLRIQSSNTFASVADEFIAKFVKEGHAEVTLKKKRWLLDMATSEFGNEPIAELTAADILDLLKKIEAQGNYETARRLRSTIGQVFRYGVSTSRVDQDPTHALKGALVSPKVRHRAAITDYKAFQELMADLWTYSGSVETVTGLKLLALLYPRPGELRNAKWEEFDLEKSIWTIPAARTKMRREHRKPLSTVVVSILTDQETRTGGNGFVLPAQGKANNPISENTFNQALRRIGYDTSTIHCSHGFRATASSLLNESRKWSADAIEAELAHISAGDEIRRVYHRARYWDERVKMADWWADQVMSGVDHA